MTEVGNHASSRKLKLMWRARKQKMFQTRTEIPFFFIICCLFFVFSITQQASANLVQNGDFTNVTYSGTPPPGVTTLFGQFGNDTGTTPATGSVLTVANWSTKGYNFVYAPNTADYGTQASAYNAGAPPESPGQYTVTVNGSNYGNTYLWGTNNGGSGTIAGGGIGTIDAAPGGGNFIAMDGVYEVYSVSQRITGLTVGQSYILTFYYAGAQQQAYTGNTTENLTVNFGGTFVRGTGNASGSFTGGTSYTTNTINLSNESFSGWYQSSVIYNATSTSTTLSFLAGGTPAGEPPFTLLSNVDLEVLVPDFSSWAVFFGFGSACLLIEMFRRRQAKRRASANGNLLDTVAGHDQPTPVIRLT